MGKKRKNYSEKHSIYKKYKCNSEKHIGLIIIIVVVNRSNFDENFLSC